MTVVVVATIRPLPDHHAEVVSALESAIARVHAEDEGCLLYALHEGPDRLVMVEKWSSAEALDKHAHGSAVAALNQALDGLVAGSAAIQVLQPHPAGTAQQGTL